MEFSPWHRSTVVMALAYAIAGAFTIVIGDDWPASQEIWLLLPVIVVVLVTTPWLASRRPSPSLTTVALRTAFAAGFGTAVAVLVAFVQSQVDQWECFACPTWLDWIRVATLASLAVAVVAGALAVPFTVVWRRSFWFDAPPA